MPLAQLIYVSHRTKDLNAEVLERIVRRSARDNAQRDITGVLLCCGQNIMQLLEGELEEITALFNRISTDPRHTHVQMLLSKNVAKRTFPEWGMGIADLDTKAPLDRTRLSDLIESVRANNQTSHYSVEARVLLNDFKQQLVKAA